MTTIFYRNKKDAETKILETFRVGSWIHVDEPNEDEISFVTKRFALDKHLVEDVLDPYEVPRIETDMGKLYIFTRYAHNTAESTVITSPVLFIIGPDFFLSIAKRKLPIIDKFNSGVIPFFTTHKTKLLVQMLLAINADYEYLIKAMSKRLRQLSGNIEKIHNKNIAQFVDFETILNDFLFGLEPYSIALEKLLTGKHITLYEEDRDLIEDLILSTEQLEKMCKSSIKHVVNVREAYTNVLSNNMNKTIKLLTSVTLILTIPTMVGSFYGMNVALPFQDSPLAFVGTVVFSIVVSFLLIWIFFKKDLL